jgi:hypothetical protein
MSARLGYLFAVVGLLLLGAWALFEQLYRVPLSGRVFIVQRDARVNRLALLRVVAVRAEDAARWKDTRRADRLFLDARLAENGRERSAELASVAEPFAPKLAVLAQHLAAASEALELANHAWAVDSTDLLSKRRFYLITGGKDFPRSLELEALVTRSDWFGAAKSLRDAVLPELRQEVARLEEERARKLAAVRRDFDERERLLRRQMEDFFAWEAFASLPASLAIAAEDVTDDNGEFKLRLPRGEYVVFTEGQRTVYAQTERYLWAQPVSVGSHPDKFMLSNHNLAGQPGSFWHDLLQGRDWPEAGH